MVTNLDPGIANRAPNRKSGLVTLPSALEVAAQVLRRAGAIDVSGLHRLVYYSQVRTLVETRQPLFGERIEAWSIGPVVPELFRAHEGKWRVQAADIAVARITLDAGQTQRIDNVVKVYGHPRWQSVEDALWYEARRELGTRDLTGPEITPAAMLAYYH